MTLSPSERSAARVFLAARIIERATRRAAERTAAAMLLRGESVAAAPAVERESRLQAALARRHFRRCMEKSALWHRYCALSDAEKAAGSYSGESLATLKRWAWAERRAKHLIWLADPQTDRTMGGAGEPIALGLV